MHPRLSGTASEFDSIMGLENQQLHSIGISVSPVADLSLTTCRGFMHLSRLWCESALSRNCARHENLLE